MGKPQDQPRAETKPKSIMLRVSTDDYLAIRQAAYLRGMEMGPMLLELLAPVVKLLKPPTES